MSFARLLNNGLCVETGIFVLQLAVEIEYTGFLYGLEFIYGLK